MEENMSQALNDIETFHLEPPPLFANIDNGGSNNDVAPSSGSEVADTASDIPTSMSMDAAPEIKNLGAKTKTEKVPENPEMPQTVGEVLASLSWNDASEGNGEGGSELTKDSASSHNIADSTDIASADSASVKTSMDNANGTFANTASDLTSVDDVSMTSMDTVNNLTSVNDANMTSMDTANRTLADTASDLTSKDDANMASMDTAASDLTSVDRASIMPSLDCANEVVSEDHASKMVSEDHAKKMVSGSEDHANKMISVSEDHTNKMVSGSKDHANKMVSEDHANKMVSKDHADKMVSEDHASKMVSDDHANNAMSLASDSNISLSCDNSMTLLDCDKNITSLDSAKGSTLAEDGKELSSGTQKNSSISDIAPTKDNVSASSSAVSDVTQSVSGMIMPTEGISSEDSSRTEAEPNISTVQLVPASLSVTQKEQETKASSSDHTNQPTSQTPGSMKVKQTMVDRCQTEETSPKLLTIVLERCKVSPDGTMKITSEMECIRNVRQPKTLKGKSGKAGRPRKDSSVGPSNAVHQKGEVSLKKVGSPQKDLGVKKAGRPKKSLDTTVEVVGTDKKELSAKAKNDNADQSEVQKNDNDSSGKRGVKRKYVRKSEASESVSPKRKYVRKEQTPVADSPKRKYVRKNQTSVAHLLKRKYVRKNQTAVPDSPKRKYVRKNLTPIASSLKRKYVRKDQTATANLTKRKYVRKDQALEVQTPKRKYVRKAQTEEDKPKRKYVRKDQALEVQTPKRKYVRKAQTEEDKPKRKYVRKAQTTEEDKPKRKYVRKDQTSVAQMLKRKYERKEMNPSNAGMNSIAERGVLKKGKRKFTLKHSLRSFDKRSMRSLNSMNSSVSSQEKADSVGNTTVIPHGKKKVKLERKPPPESPPLDPTLPVVEVDRDGEPVDDLSIFEHDQTVSNQPNKSSFSRGRRKRGGRRKQVIQPTEESTSDPPLTVITPKPFMKTGCDKNHECCRKNAVFRQDESTQWEDPSEWFAAIDRSLSMYLGMNYGHVVFSQSTPGMPGQSTPQSVIIQKHPVMAGAHENTSVLSGIQSGNLVRKISAGTPPTATMDYNKVAHPKHLVHNQAIRHVQPTMMPVASQEIHRPTLPANTSVSMTSGVRHNLKFPDSEGKIWNVSLASDNVDSNDIFGVSQVPGNVPSASGHPQNIPPGQRTVTVVMRRNSSLVPQDIPSQKNVASVQQTVPLQRNTSSHKPTITPDNIHKTCPQTFSPWKSASTVQQSVPSQSNVAPSTETCSAQDQKPDSAVRQVLMSKISADVVSRNTRNTSQDQASEQIGSVSSDDSVILIDD